MARMNSHSDLAPFVCDSCCMPVEDVTCVVTEAGYRGDRDQPGYDATIEGWCQKCVDAGGFLAVANDDYQRERGEDDGVEYGDPRDVI